MILHQTFRTREDDALAEHFLRRARDHHRLETELLDCVQRIELSQVHLKFNYRSLFRFCVDFAKIPDSLAFVLITVARTCVKVPALKRAVDEGLPLFKANRLCSILTPDNADEWIATAGRVSKAKLERLLVEACPPILERERIEPTAGNRYRVTFYVSEDGLARIERAREVADGRAGRHLTLEETVDQMAETYLFAKDEVARAVRNQNRRNASVKTRRLARDKGRCQMIFADGTRCPERVWTDGHHKVARANGGGDGIENMTTLCKTCHQMWHRQQSDVWLPEPAPRPKRAPT